MTHSLESSRPILANVSKVPFRASPVTVSKCPLTPGKARFGGECSAFANYNSCLSSFFHQHLN
jgi:hypothetical protein